MGFDSHCYKHRCASSHGLGLEATQDTLYVYPFHKYLDLLAVNNFSTLCKTNVGKWLIQIPM
jgi:hypothetical protein